MSRSFKRGLDDVFFAKEAKKIQKTNEQSIRFTLYIDQNLLSKVKGLAYWDKKTLKEVIHNALQQYIDVYEHKNGEIKLP